MKNKKDIIDLLQNADEDTIGKITEAYPQHSKKNADRLFREIERRTSGDSSEFRGDTVSGVERYRRPGIFRKVTSVAACLAIVGAGVGTAYALSRSKAPDKTAPASQVTEGSTAADNTKSPVTETKSDKDELYALILSSNDRYDRVYAKYETNEDLAAGIFDIRGLDDDFASTGLFAYTVQYDKKAGTVYTVKEDINANSEYRTELSFKRSGVTGYYIPNTDIYYPGRHGYLDEDGNTSPTPEFFLPAPNSNSFLRNMEWSVSGKTELLGRECAVITFPATDVGIYTLYVDIETGLFMKYGRSDTDGSFDTAYEVTELLLDDDTAGIDFMTAGQFKDLIKDSIHGQDTSFLDDEPEAKTAEAVTTTEAAISATTVTTEITTAETATAVKTTTETKTTTAAGTTTAVTTSTTFSDPESYLEFTEELSIARGEQKYFGFRTLCADLESVEIAGESQNDLKVVSSYSTAMMGNNYASFNIKCSENAKTGVHYIIIKHRPYTINNHMVTYSDEVFTVKIPITVTETGSDVFAMLDALDYHAISCDGIPTHKLTAPDGTVYYLHLADTTEGSYVWRRPSLIADADNEAPLTAAVIAALRAHWDELDIT